MTETSYRLRPEEAADEAFLRRLYASSRAGELGMLGWSPAQLETFLEMQFNARARSYSERYPEAEKLVILVGEEPAGRLFLNRTEAGIGIVDIALLPEHRGGGIGARLIAGLQAEGAAAGQAVVLSVEAGNPAARLYGRLGFQLSGGDGVYQAMAWLPEPAGAVAGR